MKLITSLVRPDKVDAVKEALGKVDVVALTVADARDLNRTGIIGERIR